jgi:PadR family transcriptional regulator, regulatory protein PadR
MTQVSSVNCALRQMAIVTNVDVVCHCSFRYENRVRMHRDGTDGRCEHHSRVKAGCTAAARPLIAHLDILLDEIVCSPRMSTKGSPRGGGEQEKIALLQGTLDLLILRTLEPEPLHGHAIAKAIERASEDVLQVEQGSLYPALHRLLKRGWITYEPGTSENNRAAKYYRLTAKGRRQLAVETSKWDRLARAVAHILRPA